MSMKIKFEVELELPAIWDRASEGELRQVIYDQFIKRPWFHHMNQLTEILASNNYDTPLREALLKNYREWADITREPKWEIIPND